jgi:hypothetical protein
MINGYQLLQNPKNKLVLKCCGVKLYKNVYVKKIIMKKQNNHKNMDLHLKMRLGKKYLIYRKKVMIEIFMTFHVKKINLTQMKIFL